MICFFKPLQFPQNMSRSFTSFEMRLYLRRFEKILQCGFKLAFFKLLQTDNLPATLFVSYFLPFNDFEDIIMLLAFNDVSQI